MMLVIVFTLVILVLLFCLEFHLPQGDDQVPVVFKISSVSFVHDTSGKNVRGIVSLTNTRSENYRNRYLMVITYVNGRNANVNIPTLNNDMIINGTNHAGLYHLWGVGTNGGMNSPLALWPGNSAISIEYSKGIIRPGDTIILEVFDTKTGQIISRDTYPPEKKYTVKWFYNYFLNHQAA
jgi:hypothetical protein